MAQTKINASQTTITAEDIGAAGAVTTMPTASADNLNKIVQYIGETAGNYVNGYFYKCVQGVIPESFVKIEDVTNPEAEEPTYWVIEVTDFERFRTTYCMQDGQPVASRLYFGCGTGDSDVCYNYTTETEFEPVYVTATDGLDLVECQYSWGSGDYSGDGVLYQYTPASSGYTWERVDVQPGVAYTAGTGIDITNNAISVDDTVLVNNPTGTSSVNIKGSNNNNSNSVAVGSGAAVTNNQGVAVGWGSQAGYDCTAVGAGSLAYDDYSTAIGFGATVPNGVDYSIQIGNGTNNTSGTMSVALSTDGSSWTNYELLSANGTIPEARLADTTNAQQGDVLTLDANGDAVWQTGGSGLPSQTGNAGKFLTTDGTDASWATINALTNNTTQTNSLAIIGSASGVSTVSLGDGASAGRNSVSIGYNATSGGYGIAIGNNVSVGYSSASSPRIVIGFGVKATGKNAIQLGFNDSLTPPTNSDANTVKIANDNGNFEIMSADGTIPADRLKNSINKYSTMPTAASTNEGWIVQYTGATDSTYTHGYLYECVSDGGNPATYSWTAVQVQAGGGSSLPSQTGNSGKFLTTDGTNASWGNSTHQSLYFRSGENVQYGARVFSSGGQVLRIVAVNAQGQDNGYGYSFGVDTFRPEGTNFNLGESVAKWGTTYTTKINNGANITVPSVAGEMAVKQVNTTITLTAAGWSSNTQTVNVTGMTATGVVLVSPDPTDQADYTSAGIICTSQTTNSLTFTATTTPTSDIDVNIVCL